MYNNLGVVCTDLEEWMEASLYFARGIEIAEQGTLAEVEVSRGTLARLERDFAAANSHLERALTLSAREGLEREHALAVEAVAQLWWDQGRMPEALEQLRRASETFRALGSQRDAARVEEILEEWETGARRAAVR